ncbi:amidohydrolase family protein [Amycolatopsis dendrobii]|uniref:Amidohydrolase family protein n=1 Tax=Amycolatopsis dendrobii TaxID=2760662 RepID=A0A7W3VY86_9PSEU|nr:amidohydrolase family protein [Amycolatopsis dendrobii]MBB1155436.1 amidohydrolase family protein [Amycolatopsis dendrobii]
MAIIETGIPRVNTPGGREMFDCHAHLWDPAAGFPWLKAGSPHLRAYRAKDLETAGTGLGITGTVLVEASRGDAGETLALRELRRRHPELIAGYVGNLHVCEAAALRMLLTEPDAPNGMRIGGADWSATPPEARALVPMLADAGRVLELNLHRHALRTAAEVAIEHPSLTVVADHLGNPSDLDEWQRELRDAATVPNVVVKLSGLLTQPHGNSKTARQALDAVGADRCVVGSDWPICLPRGSRADSLAASVEAVSLSERDQILLSTPRRVYRLAG